ncbi:hypothetical protein M2137_002787 [Parabacteroides sp. PFB2-10]|uniref:DUF3667 domain-containing protein n=1 Tax=Parabacteroides sp. PFB2-10 TaxID=1742405 RepID=UPI002474EED1|nr:DUF3667 domain-containing protein [Parabacteroides sp. PFB2-10]MDH6313994.1 hypothetical protein [Parabacteroides sp. PFB2-10]
MMKYKRAIFTKKKKALPIHCICRNCETPVISRYCHHCGQDIFAGRERTVREIMANTLETIFAFDNKILRTLKYLLFFPGKLTKEFFAGRVVRYVYPAKLFWFATLLFFAVLALTEQISDQEKEKKTPVIEKTEIQNTTESENTTRETLKQLDQEELASREIKDRFISYIPYSMLILVPIFAFLLLLFFYRNKKYYAHHLIFSLHFHAFVFIYLAILVPIEMFVSPVSFGFTPYVGVISLYFLVALYVVYSPKKKRHMLWKIPLVMLFYAIFIAIAAVILAILVFTITTKHFNLTEIFQ